MSPLQASSSRSTEAQTAALGLSKIERVPAQSYPGSTGDRFRASCRSLDHRCAGHSVGSVSGRLVLRRGQAGAALFVALGEIVIDCALVRHPDGHDPWQRSEPVGACWTLGSVIE